MIFPSLMPLNCTRLEKHHMRTGETFVLRYISPTIGCRRSRSMTGSTWGFQRLSPTRRSTPLRLAPMRLVNWKRQFGMFHLLCTHTISAIGRTLLAVFTGGRSQIFRHYLVCVASRHKLTFLCSSLHSVNSGG